MVMPADFTLKSTLPPFSGKGAATSIETMPGYQSGQRLASLISAMVSSGDALIWTSRCTIAMGAILFNPALRSQARPLPVADTVSVSATGGIAPVPPERNAMPRRLVLLMPRRLVLLLLALSLVFAAVAAASSGPSGDDTDGDGVANASDACPNEYGDQPNGCPPFQWKFFFNNSGIKSFLTNKTNTTYCRGIPECKATHVTLTLSAATAKAAGITKRRISSFSVPVPTMGFGNDISAVDRRKLGKLKKITLTVEASATLGDGKVIKAAPRTSTITTHHGVQQQFNNTGTDPDQI